MDLPEKKEYQETTAYYIWMGEDKICRVKVKDGANVGITEAREVSQAVQSYGMDKEFSLLVDARGVKTMSKEARDFLSLKDRPSPVVKMAIIIGSPLSRVVGNFYIGLNRTRVPSKLYTQEAEALKWLKMVNF